MGDITRLKGDDGFVVIGDLGTVVIGDDVKSLDTLMGGTGKGARFFRVTDLGGDTLGTLKVGDVFYDDGETVLPTGVKVAPLPDHNASGKPVKSWKMDFKRKEYDATTLGDDNDVFLLGRTTITGSLAFVEDVTEDTIVKRFVDTVSGTTVTEKVSTGIWAIMFQQGGFIPGERVVCFVGKFEIGSYSAGAQVGNLQEYTVDIKPAVGEKVSRVVIDLPAS